ncbi:hypothetical protein AXW84_06065 [Hymenobacter sp. PAMC 26628]|nr:hypothetical protein AXW84_06065 [Hymenobacter sp. PAMC 26628]
MTLLSYGPYGLSVLNLVGWLVRAQDGQEFYCQLKDLAGGEPEPETVEAEELPPTVSPGRRETTLDRLRAYYAAKEDEPVVLTAHQQGVLTRYEAAWGLLLAFKSSEHVLEKLMKVYDISRAQAYRDLASTKLLFGDVVKSSQAAERHILKEMAMYAFREAKRNGPKFLKELNKAIANLIKITGIEKADPNVPDEAAFLPSNYVLELKPAGGKTLKLDLEKIAQLPAHEYEEVMEIIQGSGTSEVEMLQKIMDAARGTVE